MIRGIKFGSIDELIEVLKEIKENGYEGNEGSFYSVDGLGLIIENEGIEFINIHE